MARYTAWKSVLAAVLLTLPVAVNAAEKGNTSPYDYRIKTIEYNPMDTVRLDGIAGLATHIQVAPDEKYVTHAFGQSGGWAFTHVENNYFIRPKAEMSDTNLTIVTDKRTYHFLLRYVGSYTVEEDGVEVEKFINVPWTMRNATVALRFEYPMEDMQEATQRLKDRRIQEALNEADPDAPVNLDYQMSNEAASRGIQPLNVWDNYEFTYFRFPKNATLPTLFVIGPDGEESMVNAAVEGEYNNVMVAQRTAREWRIRYGDQVVGIVNNGFNPSLGGNPSGTVSPNVKRVVKDAEGEQ